MTLKDTIKQKINQVLKESYGFSNVPYQIEYPPSGEIGDYSSNVALVLARQLKKNSLLLGEEIKKSATQALGPEIEKIEVVKPGFINFYLSEKILKDNLKEILKKKEKFGSARIGQGKKIVIDYSSPNVAKNMHAGHLRSTIIGDALARIFEFLGYKVISDNHLGDWGTQYGILLYEYKNRYGTKIIKDLTIDELEKMYVEFIAKEKNEAAIRERAKIELKKLQAGDKVNLKLWRHFYRISLKEFKKIYSQLKIRPFDLWQGESFYNEMLSRVVESALAKKTARKSQGAVIINLEKFHLPPMLIQKADGAFLYGTTDLATLIYRQQKYKPGQILYVVANQQALHFEQLFKAAELLELHNKENLVHVKFGLMLGKDNKKMSTREGGAIKLTALINEIIAKARQVAEEKNPKLTDKEKQEIAQKVGLGALKYNDLSQNRLSDIAFDWQKMLNFESGSAPYLQYTYVRIQNILDKSKVKPKNKNLELLKEPSEILLLRNLIKFGEVIIEAAENYKPNLLANYLDELATNFHHFYEEVPVIKAEKNVQAERLALINGVAQVIKNGLNLLGIEVMKKM